MRLTVIAIGLAILGFPELAQSYQGYCPCGSYIVDHGHYRERVCRRCERVYGYERRNDEDYWERRDPAVERGIHCKPEMVRVVGDAHLTQDGALNAAIRQWQATVRYDSGEKFMSIESARGYRWRCDRASTNESTVGKIGEALSGGTSFQRRCVVLARPCMLPAISAEEDKR